MKRRRRNRADSSIELQLTPMIDVVFLLLIFFMVTAKFVLPECKIPAFASEDETRRGVALVDEYELRIVRDAEGNVVVAGADRKGWRLESLEPVLRELRDYHDRNLVDGELAGDAGVAIQCREDIEWEAVVKVLDVVREAEIPGIRLK